MQDVRKVAFVSQRFLELQGLTVAAFGGTLLFALMAHQATESAARPGAAAQAMVLALMVHAQVASKAQAAYRRTFGEAVATSRQKLLAFMPMLLVSSGAIADIARELDPARSGPSFAALGLAASASWIVARDWPRRTYYAIAALCGIAGAILAVTTHDYLHAYTLVGVGLVASGLCDHYLLAHSMRRAQAGDAANVSTRRTAVSGWRRAWFGFVLALTGAIHLAASDTWMAAFPLTLMLALLAAVVVPATFDSLHAVRDFHGGRRPAPNESILECSDRELLAYGALAVAAAFQIGLLWPSRPFLVALAIVVASVGLAVTTPRGRIVHAVRAFTVAIALIWFFTLSPARAFLALVCALAIPVMIEGIMQLWMPVHRESDHADTI